MSKQTIITSLNYDLTEIERSEFNDGSSMTYPDMELSLKEIAETWTRKRIEEFPSFEEVYYGESADVPDFGRMDAVDKLSYAQELGTWIQEQYYELKRSEAELKADKSDLKKAEADLQKLNDSLKQQDDSPSADEGGDKPQ